MSLPTTLILLKDGKDDLFLLNDAIDNILNNNFFKSRTSFIRVQFNQRTESVLLFSTCIDAYDEKGIRKQLHIGFTLDSLSHGLKQKDYLPTVLFLEYDLDMGNESAEIDFSQPDFVTQGKASVLSAASGNCDDFKIIS